MQCFGQDAVFLHEYFVLSQRKFKFIEWLKVDPIYHRNEHFKDNKTNQKMHVYQILF